MKYEVKGLTSYGVYDGDRLLGSYESEKTAELIAEALNEEAGRGEPETALVTPGFEPVPVGWRGLEPTSNGHDKETI